MSEIIFLKNNIKVETILINKRYQIRHRDIQKLLETYYLKKEEYKIKCTCKDEDIFMHLINGKNYINIGSKKQYADKHAVTCPFNSLIIKLNEEYYEFKDEVFTTNIFLDESTSLKPNEDIEHDNFSYRLATQDDDNINISQRTSKNYIRYKNYNDFCLLVLQNTLKKLNYNNISSKKFESKCRKILENTEVYHNKKNTKIIDLNAKLFYYKAIILDSSNKTEFLKIKDDCHRHTQKKFLDKLSPSNSNPILIIYFKTNFKITSLFAIDVKLIIEQKEDLHKKEDYEDKLAKEKTLLASNKLEKNELEIELNSIKKDNSLLEKRKKSLLLEIEEINIEIDRLNGLKDKVLFFMENKNKTEPLKKVKQTLEKIKNILNSTNGFMNDNFNKINYLNERRDNLNLEIVQNLEEIIILETLIEKGFTIENKFIDLNDLKEKLKPLI